MSSMEEFFLKLKTDEEVADEELVIIKDVFMNQKLKLKQLMKSGDLAITDEKLERIGIKQMGLRTAILSVIESSQ